MRPSLKIISVETVGCDDSRMWWDSIICGMSGPEYQYLIIHRNVAWNFTLKSDTVNSCTAQAAQTRQSSCLLSITTQRYLRPCHACYWLVECFELETCRRLPLYKISAYVFVCEYELKMRQLSRTKTLRHFMTAILPEGCPSSVWSMPIMPTPITS